MLWSFLHHPARCAGLPVALGLLISVSPASADHGPFGICMTATVLPGGPWGAGPFGGYECGDGVSANSWTPTSGDGLAYAFGAADAATATVRSRASTWDEPGNMAVASASMWVRSWDTLTFAADGEVTLHWRFDGAIDVRPLPLVGQYNLVGMWFGFGPTFGWNYWNHDDPDPYHLGSYDIQGSTTQHVTAGQPYVVYSGLQTNAGGPGVDVDFSHTGRVVIDLPAQQSFSSASGLFLTATVPEPATPLMLVAGLALLGSLRRGCKPSLRSAPT